ncbi:MAG TPA: hypothetical protein VL614_05135 [Acetobacteraceae bacterium]|jgi:hypothetical protein|nr:hypothetical protein [Acetobacteraceae bacterium]
MTFADYPPGARAPAAGHYEELNVFGARTGKVVEVQQDEALPSAPRGFTWRPLCQRSAAELRDMAQEYRRKAATATTREIRDALQRLGRKCGDLAAAKDSPQ